jgi:hypothetical protein
MRLLPDHGNVKQGVSQPPVAIYRSVKLDYAIVSRGQSSSSAIFEAKYNKCSEIIHNSNDVQTRLKVPYLINLNYCEIESNILFKQKWQVN